MQNSTCACNSGQQLMVGESLKFLSLKSRRYGQLVTISDVLNVSILFLYGGSNVLNGVMRSSAMTTNIEKGVGGEGGNAGRKRKYSTVAGL